MTNYQAKSARAMSKRDPLFAECLSWASQAFKGEPAAIVMTNAKAEYRRRLADHDGIVGR